MSRIAAGQTIEDADGAPYEVVREFPSGAQGQVYLVRDRRGAEAVAKVAHPHVATAEAADRLGALLGLDLSSRSPAISAPAVLLAKRHGLGALMPVAEGRPLEDVFETACLGLVEALGVGAALGRALSVLEGLGVAHGDLAPSNVVVRRRQGYAEASLIDLDNAAVPGAPDPLFDGQELYAAPEILSGDAGPSVETDRFALAVLMHELLLQRYPFTEMRDGATMPEIVRAMRRVSWPEDPYAGKRASGHAVGPPVGVLPQPLQDLFRRALRPDPSGRPGAADWARACEDALGRVFACDGCGNAFVNDDARFRCAWCGVPARAFVLDLGAREVPLVGTATVVGRDDLGACPTVSRRHAVFERRGFALRLTNLSANGTAVRRGGRWTELAAGEGTDLGDGDRVRFSDGIEGRIRAGPA